MEPSMATGDEQSKLDASATDAVVAQEKYDAQKTGDPIGDADLRSTLGVPTTPQEQQQLDDQRFELAFSPDITARERFEESNPDGPPSRAARRGLRQVHRRRAEGQHRS